MHDVQDRWEAESRARQRTGSRCWYSKSNSKEFYDNLAEAIDKKIPSKVTKTQYGIVCEFREKIKGVNGKYEYANIIASIQKDEGK